MTVSSHLYAVQKGLGLLAHLNQQNGLSSTELSALVGIPRSTVFRLLKTLVAENYVNVDASHRYRITRQARGLSSAIPRRSLLAKASEPVLQGLHQMYCWPIAISSLHNHRILIEAATDCQCPHIVVRRVVGQEESLRQSAGAQMIVAQLPKASWPAFIERAQALGARSRLKPSESLSSILSQARRRGNVEIRSRQFRDIAIPIPSVSHHAALSIRLAAEMTLGDVAMRRMMQHLTAAAQDIASSLR